MQIVYKANCLDSTGYSNAARGYVLGLHRLGFNVRVENVNLGYPMADLPKDQVEDLHICMNRAPEYDFVFINHTLPTGFERRPDAIKNIGLTVWETHRIPETWVSACNQMDAIVVPSWHNARVFRESGVIVPIEYARHGVDIDLYNRDIKNQFTNNGMPSFKFLSVFQWNLRKGYDILLKAFFQEFTSEDDVCLIIKTYDQQVSGDDSAIIAEIQQIRDSLNLDYETAPVFVDTTMFSTEELVGLYKACDCFVLPSRGEGVGLPYLEAMAAGIPVIATRWGGQTDFLNEGNGYLVDYDLRQVTQFSPLYTLDQKWAEVRINDLQDRMDEVLLGNKNAEKVKAAKQVVQTDYTYYNAGLDLVMLIERLTMRKVR